MVNSFKYCKCKPLLHLNRHFHARRWSKSPCFYMYRNYPHLFPTIWSFYKIKKKQKFKSTKE